MKKKMGESQKGAISVFVMIAMVFFVITIMGIYMISSKRAQIQTETLGLAQNRYYQEGEEQEIYDAKLATAEEKIPIYTKEHLWSIGEDKTVMIEGKVYDFSGREKNQYELQNDIIINIETDLAKAIFKDDYLLGNQTIQKNNFEVRYYYKGNEYIPTNYSGTVLSDGEAVLSASGENFATISSVTTGLTGTYYLFALADEPSQVAEMTDVLDQTETLPSPELENIVE